MIVVKGEILRTVTNAISTFVKECKWCLNHDGIQCRVVDPSNVIMLDIVVPKGVFESYEIEEERVVAFDIGRVDEICRLVRENDSATLEVTNSTFSLKFNLGLGRIDYSIALIDLSTLRDPKYPKLELPAKAVMTAEMFRRAVMVLKRSKYEVVAISSDEDGITIMASDEEAKATLEISREDLIGFNGGNARSMFSLEYLEQIARTLPKADAITLNLGTNYPMEVVCDGQLKFKYVLAPRVE